MRATKSPTEKISGHLTRFRGEGLVILDPNKIRPTKLGRISVQNLAMIFDHYLEKQHRNAKPLSSRTL